MLDGGVWKGRLFRLWRKTRAESEYVESSFASELRINREDGWVSLELLLVNDASMTVWVEEATVALTDLDANWQTSIPTGQARREIRQNVRASESLGLSLAGAIYEAAGRPQGRYSCLVYIEVHYRFDDEWFSKGLDIFRVEMGALTVHGLHRLRWYEKKARPNNHPV
jgi:hypothetical protein